MRQELVDERLRLYEVSGYYGGHFRFIVGAEDEGEAARIGQLKAQQFADNLAEPYVDAVTEEDSA